MRRGEKKDGGKGNRRLGEVGGSYSGDARE